MEVTSNPATASAAVPLRPILGIACGATFLSFLDAAIVNMAFPSIAASFPTAHTSTLTWVVSGYAVPFAALLSPAGRWADTLGHRRVLLTGIAMFTLASLVCAIAPDIASLIAARAVQGAAAALLLPAALGILLAVVEPRRAHAVVGAWSAAGALAGAAGPAVGAVLVEQWNWRALFILNVPIGLGLLAVGVITLPSDTGRRSAVPDLFGIALLAAGIASLVAAITEGHQWGYHAPPTVLLCCVGLLTSAAALLRSYRQTTPALEVRLWASRSFALSNLVSAGVGFALFAYLLAIPLFFLRIWQVSLLEAAGFVGAGGIGALVSAAAVTRIATPTAARWLSAGGLAANSLGFALIGSGGLGSQPSWVVWSAMAVLLGGGVGIAITALSVITAATVPAESSSAGIGMTLTARQAGGAFGVATLSAILTTGAGFENSFRHLFLVLAAVSAVGAVISIALRADPVQASRVHSSPTADSGCGAPNHSVPVVAGYPPGPKLPAIVQTLLFARRRAWWLRRVTTRYGSIFTLRVPPYAHHLVVVSAPKEVHQVFSASAADLHGGEGNHIIGGLMGENSVLVLDEDAHARIRRLVMPAFGKAALPAYRATIADIAAAEVSSWQAGQKVVALERMNAMALDVIVRVVFGVTDPQRHADLIPRLETMARISPVVLLGLEQDRLQNHGPWKRFRDNEAQLNALLFDEIRRRRGEPNLGGRADVLSRMLAVGAAHDSTDRPLSDSEVRDQLISLLLAGHETTASALSWALLELARHPVVQQTARRAALEGDDRYLDAVFKESMRRHTVVSGTYRKLTTDMVFGQWRVPAGAFVSTSALIAHRNAEQFNEVKAFKPERFLDGSVTPHSWFPFGGGTRRCLGAAFALLEGAVILREVLLRHHLTRPLDTPDEQHLLRNVTHVPAHGARIIVTPVTGDPR